MHSQTGADVVSKRSDRLTMRVAEWVFEQSKARLARHRDAGMAMRLFGIDGDPDVAYRSSSVHSLFRDSVHPDNLDPLLVLTGPDLRRAADPQEADVALEVLQELAAAVGQSQVRFGSPTSDGGTRVLFGYGNEGDDNRLIRTAEPIELPFYWELEDVGDHLAYRYVRGKGKVGRPLWRIVERRGNVPYTPELSHGDQLLKTDYLLVTRVRNYLGGDWQSGNFIVSFAGAHGTGTRAVELLAFDRKALAAAYNDLRRLAKRAGLRTGVPECFQLLFEVKIENDPEIGSRGTKLQLVGSELIPNDEEQWKYASRCVAPALAEWQSVRLP